MKNKILSTFIILFLIIANSVAQDLPTGRDNNISSMLGANSISVTIGGNFIVNGSFPASPMERADQFITRIFNLNRAQTLGAMVEQNSIEELSIQLKNFARRNILLKRFNGEEIRLDLEKFRLTGDFKFNPYLKNDDVIIFPAVDLERSFVSIDGAVNNPVKFQFVEGDKLSDAILFAQGINKAYEDVKHAEITRLSYDGTKQNIIKVNINDDQILQRGDHVRIVADEVNRKEYKVLVIGEVNQPGYIAITKNGLPIKTVIEKSGGFKPDADLYNSELIRGTDKYSIMKKDLLTKNFEQNKLQNRNFEWQLFENRERENLLMWRMSYLTEDDTFYFKIDNDLRLLRGTGLVDFSKIYTDTTEANFLVKDGDIITVPQKSNLVYVFGQVAFTGHVGYEPGKNVDYYIQKAGGLGEVAKDFEDIWVIKGKTRNWLKVGDNKNLIVEAGDYIWVPKEAPRTFSYYFDRYTQRIGTLASIVGTVVTIILLTRD